MRTFCAGGLYLCGGHGRGGGVCARAAAAREPVERDGGALLALVLEAGEHAGLCGADDAVVESVPRACAALAAVANLEAHGDALAHPVLEELLDEDGLETAVVLPVADL